MTLLETFFLSQFWESLSANFYDPVSLAKLCAVFGMNFLVVWIIAHFFYYPKSHRRDFYFTFILLSSSIFMMIYLMDGSNMQIGAALGLFAVFGIIRYRTESVPIREMTYLFFIVSISVVNGTTSHVSHLEHIVINIIFLCVVWLAESFLLANKWGCKYVRYDNIELITPDRHDDLVADLEKRLGLKVLRVEVGAVDFLRDSTMLRVYYEDKNQKRIKSIDRMLKLRDEDAFS
ncbi:MAG: DUF4956 domain-containing protein [Alloprevotella sp.]|nr:DUF4956 domain-containing protein [Alloprevotella sp.]